MPQEPLDQVSSLVDGWRTLSRWEAEGHPGHRRWNALVDRLNRIAEVAATDQEQVRALRLIAAQDQDFRVRSSARWAVRPFVPRPDSMADLQRWLNHPQVDLGGLDLTPQAGLAVVPDAAPEGLTWFCGEPSGSHHGWPRRVDGIPLAHLLQVTLSDHQPVSKRYPALPTDGVLQFFHDLEAVGDEPADGEAGCWLVRHVVEPGTEVLVRPDDMEGDAFRGRRPARVEQTWTFPSPLDVDLDDEAFERLGAAAERVLETVSSSWGVDELADAVDAVPLMFGYGAESRLLALERLRDVLPPVTDDDGYVLLADVPGVGPLDGWVGDMGHVEFWIRDSDLAKQEFARAWALLR